MRYDILTIFPDFFHSPFSSGIIEKAQKSGLVEIKTHDIRNFSCDKHNTVDDKPYGGGGGMVMKPEPLGKAIESVNIEGQKSIVILATPQGERFSDEIARDLSRYEQIVILCGRYEGIDERIREIYVDREISIGDYVLTGGEYAACVMVDAISRFIPGVLGNEDSPYEDSFSEGFLEYPQYTRPEIYKGRQVPSVLLSGNHKEIEDWRKRESVKRTFRRRPDLLSKIKLQPQDREILREIKKENPPGIRAYIALVHYPVYNKKLKIVTTAFTNLDVHDIARAACTYGVKAFFLVQPVREQQLLVERVLKHWMEGPGAGFNPTRREALELVRIQNCIDEVLEEIESAEGVRPVVIATDARARDEMADYGELRERIHLGHEPYLILLGTGWGIAEEVMEMAEIFLAPIRGYTDYNHLSVRSAAAIILDRLFSDKL